MTPDDGRSTRMGEDFVFFSKAVCNLGFPMSHPEAAHADFKRRAEISSAWIRTLLFGAIVSTSAMFNQPEDEDGWMKLAAELAGLISQRLAPDADLN